MNPDDLARGRKSARPPDDSSSGDTGSRNPDDGSQGQQKQPELLPKVALPQGGGAIRGIGEKFSVNAATGTSSLRIPLALSPGRAGFTLITHINQMPSCETPYNPA